jgi:acetyl-CoA hydrolase
VLAELGDRRHLGVHTEMLTDGVVGLYEKGAIDGSRKTVEREKVVCSFAMGTSRLYDFVDDNAAVSFHGNEFTNDPFVIAQNDNVVAVNSAIEVDLTGQVNAEVAAGRYVGAVGGAVDFLRGAARSRGGLPIVALPSTAKGRSRIVARLNGPTSTPRSEQLVVVTEHGVADLRGLPVSARIERMLAVADPAHRADLEAAADTLQSSRPDHLRGET